MTANETSSHARDDRQIELKPAPRYDKEYFEFMDALERSERNERPTQSTRYDASEGECRDCGFVMTALMRCTRKDGDRCPRCNAYRWQVAPWLKPIAAKNRAANLRKIDPFIGVWDDDFVHECTWCGYLLAEIERRLLQCPVCCPRCAGDRWREYKSLTRAVFVQTVPFNVLPHIDQYPWEIKPRNLDILGSSLTSAQWQEFTRIEPTPFSPARKECFGTLLGSYFREWRGNTYGPWTDKNGEPCGCMDCTVGNRQLRTHKHFVEWAAYLKSVRKTDSWTQTAGLKLVDYHSRVLEVIGRGKRTMEEWIKLAFAWLFLGVVLTSGLLVFGVILASVGIVSVVTTIYTRVKFLTHRPSKY